MSNDDAVDFDKARKSLPWPRKGDTLFKGDDDWWHNACINWPHDQWDLYADGYKRAADVLVEHIKTTRDDNNVLVFPIVFLYRHHIELQMKKIIMDGNKLFDIPEEFPKHHV